MEYQERQHIQQPTGVEHQAPASLLPGVLSRLEQVQHYLTTQMSMQELTRALSDPRWEVRVAALHTAGTLGLPLPLEPLFAALHDEHTMVRVTAVRFLGRVEARMPLGQLIIALQDRAWEVREMAVQVLGERDVREVKPLLLAALDDTHHAVRQAVQQVLEQWETAVVPPSLAVEDYRMGRARRVSLSSMTQRIFHTWIVLQRQVPLIHRGIWALTALVMLMGGLLGLLLSGLFHSLNAVGLTWLVTLVTVAASATGAACIYGQENDVSLEIVLSTPTSVRLILLCRMGLVVGYNVVLAALVSAALTLTLGGGFWDMLQAWLMPLLFVSSMSLALSVLIGSALTIQTMLLLEAAQAIVLSMKRSIPLLQVADFSTWHANPLIPLLALICLAFAILYAPRQPRVSH